MWPFLVAPGVDADLMDAMEAEHAAMKQALAEAGRAIDEVVAEPNASRAQAAADTVSRSSVVINVHLEHEENDVEPLVARYEDDPEWKAVEKKLRPRRSPTPAARWPGCRTGLRTASSWHGEIIPAPVLVIIPKVFGRRYR